jgi:hypothetical protein
VALLVDLAVGLTVVLVVDFAVAFTELFTVGLGVGFFVAAWETGAMNAREIARRPAQTFPQPDRQCDCFIRDPI